MTICGWRAYAEIWAARCNPLLEFLRTGVLCHSVGVAEAYKFAVVTCGHVRVFLICMVHLFHRSVVLVCDELVAAHLVQSVSLLLNVELVHVWLLNLVEAQADSRAITRSAELVLLIPVVDVVVLLSIGSQALEKHILQFGVVWSLLELVGEGLFQEWQQGECFGRFAEHLWRHLVLERLDPLELGLVELLVVGGVCLGLTVFCQEGEVAVDEVEQQIRERNQIVSPAVGQEVEAVPAGEDQVALEEPLFGGRDVLALFVHVLHR